MKILALLVMALLITGCGGGESEEREETVGKEIADGYNRQMQKAREVEVQLQEQQQRLEEALQEADKQAPQDE